MAERVLPIVFVLLVSVTAVVSGVVLADSTDEYTVKATSNIDTPDRTIELEGDEYEVSSVGSIDEGETLRVEASRPGNSRFTLVVYNSDRQIVTSARRTENGTYSLSTGSLAPGSYVVALDQQGIQAAYPVVISGHDFDVEVPSSIKEGESLSITATVSGSPHQVNVALFNENGRFDTTATETKDGSYNATFDANLDPGEYSLYVGARGEDQVNGQHVVTGISELHTIEVQQNTNPTTSTPSTTTPTTTTGTATTTSPTSGSGGGGGGGSGGSGGGGGASGTTASSTSRIGTTSSVSSTSDTPQSTVATTAGRGPSLRRFSEL